MLFTVKQFVQILILSYESDKMTMSKECGCISIPTSLLNNNMTQRKSYKSVLSVGFIKMGAGIVYHDLILIHYIFQ